MRTGPSPDGDLGSLSGRRLPHSLPAEVRRCLLVPLEPNSARTAGHRGRWVRAVRRPRAGDRVGRRRAQHAGAGRGGHRRPGGRAGRRAGARLPGRRGRSSSRSSPTEETPEEPPPFEIPPEVVAALQQFADQAGISEECVNRGDREPRADRQRRRRPPCRAAAGGAPTSPRRSRSPIETQDPTALEEFLSGLAPSPEEEPGRRSRYPSAATSPPGCSSSPTRSRLRRAGPLRRPRSPPRRTRSSPPASYQPPQAPAAPAPPAAAGRTGGLPGLRADRSGRGRGRTVPGGDRVALAALAGARSGRGGVGCGASD